MRGEGVTAKSASAITGLVEGGVSKIDQLLTINAEVNLAAGLLAEAGHVRDPVFIQPIRERFVAATATIDRILRHLPGGPETTALRERTEGLLAFGVGSDNIFDVRMRALRGTSGDRHSLEADQKQLNALKTATNPSSLRSPRLSTMLPSTWCSPPRRSLQVARKGSRSLSM